MTLGLVEGLLFMMMSDDTTGIVYRCGWMHCGRDIGSEGSGSAFIRKGEYPSLNGTAFMG